MWCVWKTNFTHLKKISSHGWENILHSVEKTYFKIDFTQWKKTNFNYFKKPISLVSETWFQSFEMLKLKHVWNASKFGLILKLLASGIQIYEIFQK